MDTQIEATPAIKDLLSVTDGLTPMTKTRGEEGKKIYEVKDCLADEEDSDGSETPSSAKTNEEDKLAQEDNEEGFEIVRLLGSLQTSS